ncbi:hypothetical protein [Salinarimonas sp.]|uniref:hypothetical protein n=1 Tax=Salinarimonas sp. TaxID=2766526 RepID=UPI00391BACFF
MSADVVDVCFDLSAAWGRGMSVSRPPEIFLAMTASELARETAQLERVAQILAPDRAP